MKKITFTGNLGYIHFWVDAWMCYGAERLIGSGITGMRGHEIDYTIFYT